MWRHWHWLVLRRSPGGIRVLNTTAAATTGLFTTGILDSSDVDVL
jgi:hypothetical protein